MSRRSRSTIAAVFALLLALAVTALSAPVEAKSYRFTSVDIEATILSNGDLHIVEDRTARFSGSFSELWYEISLSGSDGFYDLAVYDSGRKLAESSSERTGTYKIDRDGSEATVYVYYSATNEQRTFTFDYKLRNVVTAYRDTAELYWKFIGTGWDVPTERVRIEVFYPSGVARDSIRAFAHGPLQGEVVITDSPSMLLTAELLPANTFVEARTTFPVSSVPGAGRVVNRDALPRILEEEGRWADEANEIRDRVRSQIERGEIVDMDAVHRELELSRKPTWRRWLVDYDLHLAFLVFVVALVAFMVIHIKYNREYRPEFDGDYYRELPGDYSPAILGVLWRFGSPEAQDLTAEIMNLARRGYLKVVEKKTERKRAFGLLGTATDYDYTIERTEKLEKDDSLLPYEKELIELLFALGSGETVSFDEITSYAKKHPQQFLKRFNGWKASVSSYAERFDFFDRELIRGKVIGSLIGVCLFGIGIGLLALSGEYGGIAAGLVGMISGFVVLITSLVMNRRSQFGSTELRKWQAFRKFLLDFSSMDRATIPSLVIWEHYLVYAITLGVAKEVIRQLPIVFPELRENPAMFGRSWLYLSAIDSKAVNALDSLNAVTAAMNQSVAQAIASSTASSRSGSGGGFSAGGGGGGGGTGGGAR